MGTGNGVIISVPLAGPKESKSASEHIASAFDNQVREQAVSSAPGKVMRVYTDRKNQLMTAETFIPYCSMAQAQLSFHGHRDAVKFFVSVPGNGGLTSGLVTSGSPNSAKSPPGLSASPKCIGEAGIEASSMLVMSGGEGYIDFRRGETDSTNTDITQLSRNERSFLVVWQVPLIPKQPNTAEDEFLD
jgi:mitogen-activated protein kinase 8 interacting protein 3